MSAERPNLRDTGTALLTGAGTLQPFVVLFDEAPCLALGAECRYGCHSDAIAAERETVILGARAALEDDAADGLGGGGRAFVNAGLR